MQRFDRTGETHGPLNILGRGKSRYKWLCQCIVCGFTREYPYAQCIQTPRCTDCGAGRKRSKVFIDGTLDTLKGHAKRLGIHYSCFIQRYKKGYRGADLTSPASLLRKAGVTGRKITYKGETQSIARWAEKLGITRERLRQRLNRGTIAQAMNLKKEIPRRQVVCPHCQQTFLLPPHIATKTSYQELKGT